VHDAVTAAVTAALEKQAAANARDFKEFFTSQLEQGRSREPVRRQTQTVPPPIPPNEAGWEMGPSAGTLAPYRDQSNPFSPR
jgi:hypothetical protein